jgi:glycosyltransferase involved in cell wall biosynthesis
MEAPPARVTVLITLYNKGAYVAETVRSVLSSTFTDFELLLVDDASTDGGLEVVRGIEDPRVRILESPVNTGRAAAANRGYDHACGEYVAVLDADDLMHPERLAKQVAFMDAHPEVGVCGSWSRMMGDPSQLVRMPATDEACRAVMLFGMPVLYPAAMIRRAVLEDNRLRCDADWHLPGMDHLFMLHIGAHAAYANLQEPLLTYRMGENNMRHGRDTVTDRFALERELFNFLQIAATDAEVEMHLAFHNLFRRPFHAADVRALWAWKNRLGRINRERGLFPAKLFEAELERRWDRLFHLFAGQSVGAAMAHFRLSGNWSTARLAYLGKVTANRWLDRKR